MTEEELTLDEKAFNYAKSKSEGTVAVTENCFLGELKLAYLAGAKENGTVWHDLRKDQNDLPEGNGLFIIYWKLGTVDNYMVFRGTITEMHKDVIAWCEIPKYEVEEYKTIEREEKKWLNETNEVKTKLILEYNKEISELKNQLTEKDKQIEELKEKLYSDSRNAFAELNQETALSNERLMNEVADLEAQNEELQQKYLSESYEKAKLVKQVAELKAQNEGLERENGLMVQRLHDRAVRCELCYDKVYAEELLKQAKELLKDCLDHFSWLQGCIKAKDLNIIEYKNRYKTIFEEQL